MKAEKDLRNLSDFTPEEMIDHKFYEHHFGYCASKVRMA